MNNNDNNIQNDLNNLANDNLADLKDDGVLNTSNVSPSSVETPVNNSTNLPSEAPVVNKKKNRLPFVFVGILLLLAIAFVGYQFLWIRNSKKVMSSSISNVFDYASKSLVEVENSMLNYDLTKDVLKTSGTVQIDTDYEFLKDLSNIVFDYAADIDLHNEKLYFALGAKENGKEILTGKAYIDTDKVTVDSNVFTRPYYFNLDEELDYTGFKKFLEELPVVKLSDFSKLIDKVKKAVITTMDSKKISNQSEKVTIRGKEVSVLAHTYTIDQAEAKNLAKAVLKVLSEDDSLTILASAITQDKQSIKSSLEKAVEQIDSNSSDSSGNIVIKVYGDSLFGKFRGFDVVSTSRDKVIFEAKYVTDGSKGNFTIQESDGSQVIEGTVDYNQKDNSYQIATEVNNVKVNIVYTSKNALSKYISVKAEDKDHLLEITFDFDVNRNGSSLNDKSNITFNYKDGENQFKASIKIDGTSSVGGNVEAAPNNAANVETMDRDEMIAKLEDAVKNSSLQSFINRLISLIDSQDDIDYNYIDENDYDYDFDDENYDLDYDLESFE